VRERRGFGLVELLVSICIVTIVLVGAGVAQSVSFGLNRTTEETATAVADLESALESMLLLQPAEIADPAGPFADGQPIAAFTDLHLENQRIVPRYPNVVGGVVPDPLEIVLTITFDDHSGRQRSLSLASMRTR
jgi:prepilin-type N-terminal cleavage/methylation domain-containing protein